MAIDLKTMDKKKLIILVGAIGMGLIAAVLVNNYVQQTIAKQVAILNKAASKEDLQAIHQRVQRLERDNNQLIATVQKMASQQQQAPVAASRAEEKEKAPQVTLALKTPPGKRAITAMVDRLYAAEGLIYPGDPVDILVHLDVPTDPFNPKQKDQVTVMAFQNVQVLAIGRALDPSTAQAQNVPGKIPITFALNPQEANIMAFAQKKGNLQLVVRSPAERQAFALPVSSWETLSEYLQETQGVDIGLWGEKKEEDEAPPVEAPEFAPPIQVFRGGL